MYMQSQCGPVVRQPGAMLLLALQDVCLVRSEEVGMAVLRGGRSLNRLLGRGVSFKGAAAVL